MSEQDTGQSPNNRAVNPDIAGPALIALVRYKAELRKIASDMGLVEKIKADIPDKDWRALLRGHITRLFKCAAEMTTCGATSSAMAIATTIEMLLWIANDEELREELSQQLEDNEHRLSRCIRDVDALTHEERLALRQFGQTLMYMREEKRSRP